jgi:hypothetical protein
MLLCEVVAGQQGILKNFTTAEQKYVAVLRKVTERFSLPPPLYDQAKQNKRFGSFSFRKAVIPFVENRVDLRFADAFNGNKITPEAAALDEATSNIIMLGTSASGKTRTIFDVARRNFMIYVACLLNSGPRKDRPASDVETTGDKVFPRLCASISENVDSLWPHDPERARAEADRLILADICSRVLFAVRVFQKYPKITAEQFLLLQLNGGQNIIESYWMVILKEARTDIEIVLDTASQKLRKLNRIRFAIDEAQIAASAFVSESDFHFAHKDAQKGARALLYEYCRLVMKHLSLTQLIIAGTDLTADTAAQLPSDLGKNFGPPIVFPVLYVKDVRERLSRVLNTTGLDWNQVKNLGCLVGRCRWCATVVDALASQAEKTVDPQQKTRILDECIETCIEPVVKTMVAKLNTYMLKNQRGILKRLFAVYKLFPKPSEDLTLLFDARSIDTLLQYGLGQLREKTDEGNLVSLDDYVTRTVVCRIGVKSRWSAADVIAEEIMNVYKTQTRADLGISFQMLVAAALCEFNGTVAELVQACKPLNENMDVLPDWTTQASLSAKHYVLCDNRVDVRQRLYSNEKFTLDTLIQPDDLMRPDLVGILAGGEHGASFALVVSAKVCMEPLSGNDRSDDLASTRLDLAYLPKPSVTSPTIVEHNWERTYNQIQEYTQGRCLRLHVVLGGYSSYKNAPDDGEGVSGKQVKTVHVNKETIRVIINKGNCNALFRSEFQQFVIEKVMQKQTPSGTPT